MKKFFKRIYFYLVFIIFRNRIFTRKIGKSIALHDVKDGELILECGSGRPDPNGNYYFSVEKYFKCKKVRFVKSDILGGGGIEIIDITRPFANSEYDHILCFHVLDDLHDPISACLNLYNALKPNGHLHIISPFIYPLHDSAEFFRISPYAFHHIFGQIISGAEIVEEIYNGPKFFPSAIYLKVKKG